jgi:hypothetical protein
MHNPAISTCWRTGLKKKTVSFGALGVQILINRLSNWLASRLHCDGIWSRVLSFRALGDP